MRIGVNLYKSDGGDLGSWNEGVTGAKNVTVTNNYLYNIATEYNVYAILITKLDGGAVQYNTVERCTYSAIALGWDWDIDWEKYDAENKINLRNVDVSYNYITDFMTEMGDGSAIYLPMQNAPDENTDFYMNTVHHNTVLFSKMTGDAQGNLLIGIYFDASASNWYCFENVIIEQSYGAYAGEDDLSLYGVSEKEAYEKKKAASHSKYVYVQHIDTQETHNILVEGNFILNVRATEPDAQHKEVYQDYFYRKDGVEGRNLKERNTVYIVGLDGIPSPAQETVIDSGCDGHKGDMSVIYSNNY